MLRIKKNPLKKPACDATFDTPTTNQQTGIDMLIALNMTAKTCVIGPEVSIDAKILVTKEKPHFFFNPIIFNSKCLHSDPKDSTIHIQYKDYLGNVTDITLADEDDSIRKSVDQLHNGIERANKKKV